MLCSCVGVGADPQYVPAIVNCVNASVCVCVCDTQIVSRLSKNGQTNIGMDRKGRNWTAQNVHIFRIVCVLMKCFRIGKCTKANEGEWRKKRNILFATAHNRFTFRILFKQHDTWQWMAPGPGSYPSPHIHLTITTTATRASHRPIIAAAAAAASCVTAGVEWRAWWRGRHGL